MPRGHVLLEEWMLDPAVTYLNHGGFGATPRRVLGAQDRWRRRIEAEPTSFFRDQAEACLVGALAAAAAFVGARPEDVVFAENATAGCNTVLASLELAPGDEVVVTTHGYAAVRNAARYWCGRSGAAVVDVDVPFPLPGPDTVAEAVAAAITRRTKLVIVDHLTSPTGAVLPVERIVATCRARGVAVLVDGAHAPGHVPLDLDGLGADYYVGNLHKWAFAPRGCAILHARPERQAALRPLVISHGYGGGFQAEHGWTGTRDVTNALCVPDALAFHAELGDVMGDNARLCAEMADDLADAWGVALPVPAAMRAALCTIPLPTGRPGTPEAAARTQRELLAAGVEAPVIPFGGRLYVRIAAQVYVERQDATRLAEAVSRLEAY
jgi:isopenicillin-N epimerase